AALPTAALACSICHCDDPASTAGDLPFFFTQRWRLSLEAEQYAKDQVSDVAPAPGEAPGREKETENRYTATAAWRAHPKLTLIARVPWAHREIASDEGTAIGTGFSDPELLASACAY